MMAIKISLIIYTVLAVLAVVVYIPKLRQFLYMGKRPERKTAKDKRKISLIIPARNESGVINDLFASIKKQTYPREFFDVNVVVQSGDDPTVKLAQRLGAQVFIVGEQKCKGDALDGYFKALERQKFLSYDAFVIIDADAVLTPEYVSELNNALEYDCQIFLSRKFIKNFLGGKKQRTIYTKCSALTYAQLDDLANVYRTKKGIPMNMCGQGMMLRRDVVEELGGWPYRTLTEDYELRMDCFLKGYSSMYYPYAIIYTEEALGHKENFERRTRWVTGFSQCDLKYKKQIKQKAKEKGEMNEGEFEYFYSLVPLIIFIVITALAMGTGVGLAIWYGVKGSRLWIHSLILLTLMPFVIMYLLLQIYAILCVWAMRDAFAPVPLGEKISTVFFAPFYLLEYFPIFISGRVKSRSNQDWVPTERVRYDSLPEPDEQVETIKR